MLLYLVIGAVCVNICRAPPVAPEQKNNRLLFQNKDMIDSIPLEKLKPADHLDALKLEKDGDLNRDFKKEIFLGNHEEIETDEPSNAESKFKDIFYKVDTDQNGKLSRLEIESWVQDKIQEHFDEALEENDRIFNHMDPDGDGLVSWKSYYTHFLLAKGYPLERAQKHVEDYDEVTLSQDEKEQLIRYKFSWSDADVDPVDNKLNKVEFLAFRHPEQSPHALDIMVQNILTALDKNDDYILEEKEFIALPPGESPDDEQRKLDDKWQQERLSEFRKYIDTNHDKKVTREELKAYVDPRAPHQALSEATNLISLIDEDGDGELSFEEVMKHKDIFINSKVVETKRNLHDEF